MDLFTEFEASEEALPSDISVQELDEHIQKLLTLRADYEAKKKDATEANKLCEEQENFIMGILEKLNRTSYEVDGVGKVIKVTQTVYKVPKDISEKKALFDYIKQKYGGDVLMNMVSINHQTLNGWAKQEIQETSKIPGLELPTLQEYLQVRRK